VCGCGLQHLLQLCLGFVPSASLARTATMTEVQDTPRREKSDDMLRSLTERENLALGMASGCAEQLMIQPMLYFKNASQQGIPFSFSQVHPRIMYRGTFISCCNFSALCGMQFLCSGIFQKLAADGSKDLNFRQEVTAGFLGGAASGPLCCSMELIMIQQQRFGGTSVGTFVRLLRSHGACSLMRGLAPSTAREAFYTAGYLGTVPATRKHMSERYGLPWWLGDFLGAASAGVFCTFITQPLDTVKTCMQGDMSRSKYGSFLQTFRALHQEYGSFRAFYRGYWWRCGMVVIDFLALNAIATTMAPIMFPGK